MKLVTNEQVVEVVEFETTNPALRGDMTITITLADADGGTDLLAVHDGLPGGLSTAENETGWRMSLAKLAAFAEAGLDGTATPKSGHKKRPNKPLIFDVRLDDLMRAQKALLICSVEEAC